MRENSVIANYLLLVKLGYKIPFLFFIYYNMKICIGIISYFPEGPKRNVRIERASKVIDDCNKLFNLPIIIIAQN